MKFSLPLLLGVAVTAAFAQSPPPAQGLALWLKADAGVVIDGTAVAQWLDQSGNNIHAGQATASLRPVVVPNAINGRPALQFDGVNDFLTFELPMNGYSGATLILVSACDANLDGGANGVARVPLFWNETSAWGTLHVSPFQRFVKFRFGTGQASNLPAYTRPASIGASFSVTTAWKSGSNESLFVNGAQVLTLTGKLPTLARIHPTGNLGRAFNNTYFPGRIAEVLVYTRALTDPERQQVEQYLIQKYLQAGPPVNQPPVVSAGSDQTVTLPAAANLNGTVTDDSPTVTKQWSKFSGPGTVTFGDSAAVSTTASFSAPGSYVLRLLANDGEFTRTDDVAITVSPAAPPGTVPTAGLNLWLKADAGVVLNGTGVEQWLDQSGNNTNAIQATVAARPALVSNAVQFDGVNDFLTFELPMNGLTAATLFLVSASDADIDGTANGVARAPLFWNETSAWGTLHLSPFQRFIKFRFGTGQASNLPSYTRPASIGNALSVTTARKNGSAESIFVNGASVLQLTGKQPSLAHVHPTGNLGRGFNNTYFPGRIAEVLVYNRALNDTERQQVEQYLIQKYLQSSPPVNQPPTVSAGTDQTITLPAAANLSGTVTDDSPTVTKQWSKISGPGTVTFGDAASLSTTANFSAAGPYVLQLSASDGEFTRTDDVAITANPPVSDTTPPQISNILVTNITANSATITWTTDEPSDSQVAFGPTVPYVFTTALNTTLTTNHSINLTALQADNEYHFSVRSRDSSQNPASSPDQTFRTRAVGWWNTQWHYRLPVEVAAGPFEREERPAEYTLNFTQVFSQLSLTDPFPDNSLRVIEVDSAGAILDEAVAFQFDKAANYNAQTNAAGMLVWLMKNGTAANGTRYFHIYFDNFPKTPASFTAQVTFTDSVMWEQQLSYRIGTPYATYYYHKQGAGFASMIDVQGKDWITYHPSGGPAGNYRGIPNLIYPEGGFHAGYADSTSQVVTQGPIKLTLQSATNNGKFAGQWEIFPRFARFTLTKADHSYWFLYEGTPGGAYNATDFYVRSNGVQSPAGTQLTTDLPDPEWVYFGDAALNRVIYLAKHWDDTVLDGNTQSNNAMTVFGFGRRQPSTAALLTTVPAQFTIGFAESSVFSAVSKVISSSYRDLTVTQKPVESQ